MSQRTVEQRLVILEKAVTDLQKQILGHAASKDWLEHLIGSVSDDSTFLEALEYGRSYRQSDKPIKRNMLGFPMEE